MPSLQATELAGVNAFECAEQLAQSERGHAAMQHLLAFLEDCGLGLDDKNKNAFLDVLFCAWYKSPMDARDALRGQVGWDTKFELIQSA